MSRYTLVPLWAFLLAIILMLLTVAARAQPPDGSTGENHDWYEGLRMNGSGIGCCGEGECRPVDARTSGDHWQALVEDGWIDIPNDKIIHPRTNPIGRAVLCRAPSSGVIYCFTEPELT